MEFAVQSKKLNATSIQLIFILKKPAHFSKLITMLVLSSMALSPAIAQSQADIDRINKNWDKIKVGPIQTPGEIQTPKGNWQVPGEIQVPKGIQQITEKCKHRLLIKADTLFDFDKYTLTEKSAAVLSQLGPALKQFGVHPITIEGHTDAKGSDDYNQKLSEKRAEIVRDWLVYYKFIPAASVAGFGKRQPVAPNTNPDGSDNPEGRALNRRVEIVVDTCK
jgi:outer membrane protein OmpA-like peptidoglycan-associated protein